MRSPFARFSREVDFGIYKPKAPLLSCLLTLMGSIPLGYVYFGVREWIFSSKSEADAIVRQPYIYVFFALIGLAAWLADRHNWIKRQDKFTNRRGNSVAKEKK
jgi:hypothetical protein